MRTPIELSEIAPNVRNKKVKFAGLEFGERSNETFLHQ
jgi:hypothetical protein